MSQIIDSGASTHKRKMMEDDGPTKKQLRAKTSFLRQAHTEVTSSKSDILTQKQGRVTGGIRQTTTDIQAKESFFETKLDVKQYECEEAATMIENEEEEQLPLQYENRISLEDHIDCQDLQLTSGEDFEAEENLHETKLDVKQYECEEAATMIENEEEELFPLQYENRISLEDHIDCHNLQLTSGEDFEAEENLHETKLDVKQYECEEAATMIENEEEELFPLQYENRISLEDHIDCHNLQLTSGEDFEAEENLHETKLDVKQYECEEAATMIENEEEEQLPLQYENRISLEDHIDCHNLQLTSGEDFEAEENLHETKLDVKQYECEEAATMTENADEELLPIQYENKISLEDHIDCQDLQLTSGEDFEAEENLHETKLDVKQFEDEETASKNENLVPIQNENRNEETTNTSENEDLVPIQNENRISQEDFMNSHDLQLTSGEEQPVCSRDAEGRNRDQNPLIMMRNIKMNSSKTAVTCKTWKAGTNNGDIEGFELCNSCTAFDTKESNPTSCPKHGTYHLFDDSQSGYVVCTKIGCGRVVDKVYLS